MNVLHWLSRPELAALALALGHFLWQGTLIALFLAAAVRCLRIERATQRYACSLAALLAMALCPVITYFAAAPPAYQAVAIPADEVEIVSAAAVTSEPSAALTPNAGLTMQAITRGAQPYLLAVWLAGVVALGLRLIGGLVGVVRLSRYKLPLSLDLARRVEHLGKALRIDALPRVFLSRAVSEALVVGFWRPIVLVPAAWASEMPLVVLEAIIAHELAHIRRLDLWVNLLQRLVETLLFYHPAVWWVSRQLRHQREMCCDELAVAATGRRVEYAETLELVARERLAGVRPALSAGIRGESNMKLLARVRNVLGSPANEASGLWPAGVLALLLPLGLWTVTWGVLSPSTAAAVAADDDDEGDDREERDDDDGDRRERGKDREDDDGDEREDRRAGNREREDDDDEGERKAASRERDDDQEEADDKKAVLRKFLESRKEGGEEREREEGDAPKKEGERKEGDAPKKERKEGDQPPKKVRKEGEQPKKVIKEGDQPKKVIKEGAGERKETIKKEAIRKEGEAPVKKPAVKEGGEKRGDVAELAAMLKELRGEVDRLRAEIRELRGGKPGGEEGAEKLARIKSEAAERDAAKNKLLEAARDKERAADREAAERKERDVKEREAVEQKLREAARDKERAAGREAAERKEQEVKQREAAARKEALRKEADKKDPEPDKK